MLNDVDFSFKNLSVLEKILIVVIAFLFLAILSFTVGVIVGR